MNEFKSSWLVQRLEAPRGGFAGMKDNPFSFGGGLKNGGLSSEAMDLLRPIFSFEYMGAAEFEFGAVPQAISLMAEVAAFQNLVASSFTIALKDVAKHWNDNSKKDPEGEATVYLLCPEAWEEEAEERIREFARKDFTMKEATHLPSVLRPAGEDWTPRTKGWLELDNGFMFFVDEEMWRKTCELFELPESAYREQSGTSKTSGTK